MVGWNKLIQVAKSGVVQFVVLRYSTLAIQFINALIIAQFLGAYYFGIYSFVTLVLQYLTYSNLGINYSVNVLLSIKKGNPELTSKLWANSLYITFIAGILVVFMGIIGLMFDPPYFQKYEFSRYILPVVFNAILVNYNGLFVNSFRIYGKLREINIYQMLIPLGTLALLPFFKGQLLLDVWIGMNFACNLFSFLLFVNKAPHSLAHHHNVKIPAILLHKGAHLLLYNMSFYFITIAARTVISVGYSVEELGFYSFANAIANAVMTAGGAFVFVFFPKMLNRFHAMTNLETLAFLKRIRIAYITVLNLMVLASMVVVPLIAYFIPEMAPAENAILILLCSQIIINTNMGNATMLIARKQEKYLTPFGFEAILIVVVFGSLLAWMEYNLDFIALVVLLASAYYTLRVNRYALKFLGLKDDGVKRDLMLYYCLISLIVIGVFFSISALIYISILLYVILKRADIITAGRESLKLLGGNANQF